MEYILKNKKIAVLVIFVVFFAVYYSTVYRKQLKDVDLLKKTIISYDEIIDVNDEIIKRIELIDVHLKIINERINDIRLILPPEINQDEILIILQNAAHKSGLKIDNIKFSIAEKLDLSNDSATATNKMENERKITNEKLLKAMEFIGFNSNEDKQTTGALVDGQGFVVRTNISASGTNSELKKFLNVVDNMENKVNIEGLRIDNSSENQISATFDLVFYGITDVNAAKKGSYLSLSWIPKEPEVKDNIFMSYEGIDDYHISNYVDNSDSFDLSQFDFTMRVVPFSQNMGSPSVSMVLKSFDFQHKGVPVVYGDSSGQENVELFIDKKDGQYLCKFKTTFEGFPDNSFNEMTVFNPSSKEIRMLIDSTKRVSSEDISGVNISITNNSDLTFIVDVINDDNISPRVTINRITENIRVKYNK